MQALHKGHQTFLLTADMLLCEALIRASPTLIQQYTLYRKPTLSVGQLACRDALSTSVPLGCMSQNSSASPRCGTTAMVPLAAH
jgi:hypothetical protein